MLRVRPHHRSRDRHFTTCGHGIRLAKTCHDPVVQALIMILDAALGASKVIGERGPGTGGVAAVSQWMQLHPGVLHHPDIILSNFDGPGTFTLIDVKTLDVAAATHIAEGTHHTRLAAHVALAQWRPSPIAPCHVQPKPHRSHWFANQL